LIEATGVKGSTAQQHSTFTHHRTNLLLPPLSMGDFVNLVSDCGDGFDEQQVEQAILESLASE
jgi:hypothetical protein